MKAQLLKFMFLFVVSFANGQILIVNSAETDLNYSQADDSSALDINSKNDGILIPLFTTEKRKELTPPNNDWTAWEGMLVYDINLKALAYVHDGKWRILKNN